MPCGLRHVHFHVSEAAKPCGLDNTVYGHYGRGLRRLDDAFLWHHVRMISLAAVTSHAAIIAKGVNGVRRRAMLA